MSDVLHMFASKLQPRHNQVTIPLPSSSDLPNEITKTLDQLPPLNNLRMFANIPFCFESIIFMV